MALKKRLLIALFAFILLLSGCAFNPPSAEDAKVFLTQNQSEIDVIVEYLRGLNADSVLISNASGTIFYDFEDHEIESNGVQASIRHLWGAGCKSIYKSDRNNAISFEIWYQSVGGEDCGIACTIDGQGVPKTEYQIRCELITDNWFYYFDDYEEYRKHPTAEPVDTVDGSMC